MYGHELQHHVNMAKEYPSIIFKNYVMAKWYLKVIKLITSEKAIFAEREREHSGMYSVVCLVL